MMACFRRAEHEFTGFRGAGAFCGAKPMSDDLLKAGDRMMFSTELLDELGKRQETIFVHVLKIETNQDGLKIVYLGTAS